MTSQNTFNHRGISLPIENMRTGSPILPLEYEPAIHRLVAENTHYADYGDRIDHAEGVFFINPTMLRSGIPSLTPFIVQV